jgi:hypothetical protein
MHRPEICLPAAGYQLKTDRGTVTIRAKELSVSFHSLNFDYEGRPVYVFYSSGKITKTMDNSRDFLTIGITA